MRPPDPLLHEILQAGISAPSAENKHYLAYRICDEAVELTSTDSRSWAALPHRKMLGLLAFGAVLENIALRSASFGLELRAEALPESARPELIARLRWAAQPALTVDPLVRQIESRHTNRRLFSRRAIEPPALRSLDAAVASVPGAAVAWFHRGPGRAKAQRAIRLAETERFRRRALHQELFGSIAFHAGWETATDEWLAPATLEIEAPMRRPFRWLANWPAMRAVNAIGGSLMLGVRAGQLPAWSASHLGLLHVDAADDDIGSLLAGRAFQRLWLQADAAGLGLQPMAAAPVLLRQTPGADWVGEPTRTALGRTMNALMDGGSSRPYLFFRIGHAEPPTASAGRRPLKDYLSG